MEVVSERNLILEKITSTIGELPSSPAIVSAVMGLTSDLNADIDDLGKVLSVDQALTAKVLRLSNSSFYGRSKSVSSLKEAILILGFYTLRSMVIATSTHSLYKQKGAEDIAQKLWDHSLAAAMASRLAAKKIRHSKIEEIFIVGLLHDIGKVILSQKLSDAYRKVVSLVEKDKRSFIEVEEELLGFNHADVGQMILKKWNFPEALIDGVSEHHSPPAPGDVQGEPPISMVIHFSNLMAKTLEVGFNESAEFDLFSLPLAKQACFSEEQIEEMVEELGEHYADEKKLFEEN